MTTAQATGAAQAVAPGAESAFARTIRLASSSATSCVSAAQATRGAAAGVGFAAPAPIALLRCSMGVRRAEGSSTEKPVANIKSQKKRNLTNAKAAERNKSVRSELKSRVKTAVNTGDDDAVRMAVKKLDSAVSKGVIHKNTAARRKSRLMKKVNAAG
jgi:small subunit ribosomal protein S20